MKPDRGIGTLYVVLFTAGWSALALARLLTHEMWRDELQAWMIAVGSESVGQLISNLRYEGHPALWSLCLFVISRFSDSPVAMQLLNLCVGTATVFVLVRFAPFPRWLSAMLALGYYVAYEYGTISRNYGLGVLLIFVFCAIFTSDWPRRFRLMAVTLAALALTSVYGIMAAAALAAGAVVDAWIRPGERPWLPRHVFGFVAIVGIGIVAAVALIRQPPDAVFDLRLRLQIDPDAALWTAGSVWRGLVPVPPPTTAFWNSNLLDGLPYLRATAGLALVAWAFVALRRHTTALAIFAVGSIGLLLFTYLIYPGGVRHHGHHFLMFIAACWIASATQSTADSGRSWRALLVAIAIVQLAVGTFASVMDMRLSFSGSRSAAAYIESHYPADIPIVVDPELPGVPIAAWLRRDVFFAQSDRWGKFVLWNTQQRPRDLLRALDVADHLSSTLERDLLFVVNYRMTPPPRFQHLAHFPSHLNAAEAYDVYLLQHDKRSKN